MADRILPSSSEPAMPVKIVTPVPIPVVAVDKDGGALNAEPAHRVQSQTGDPSIPATTTFEQNLMTASQRDINKIWETTQMKIALSVIWAALLVSVILSTLGKNLGTPDIQLAAVVFLFGVANLVTGFYFGRTNHQRQGGVGGDTKDASR